MAKKYLEGGSKIAHSMKELVFGFNDGAVSNVALITGVAVATLNLNVVLIAGIAETIATGISMGMGEYISMKSQLEVYDREIQKEKEDIEKYPNLERKEVEQIYRKKGFRGKKLKIVVDQIVKSKKVWLKTVMAEELGLTKVRKSPVHAGLLMSFAALVGGIVPLIPFFFIKDVISALKVCILLSVLAVFLFGCIRSKYTGKHWFRSGFELTMVAVIATLATYGIGTWFHGMI